MSISAASQMSTDEADEGFSTMASLSEMEVVCVATVTRGVQKTLMLLLHHSLPVASADAKGPA